MDANTAVMDLEFANFRPPKSPRLHMNVLHLEDIPGDADLVRSILTTNWPDARITVVEKRSDYLAELERGGYDVILADNSLPSFSGLDALNLARAKTPRTPFIFLTGTLEEEKAIDAVEHGATDYLFKAHLQRLVIIVRRAVRESRERQQLVESLEKIQQLNADLERRVQERTSRLEAAVKELEAFSYSVSHDLRSPLRGIDGFARALGEDYKSALDEEGHRLIATIRDETRRMGELIDDLLAFSRAGRQQLDTGTVDMTELARSAFQQIVERSTDRIPGFQLDPLPEACADRALLRQVFTNLLDNAVKFTSRTPTPLIEVSGRTEKGMSIYRIKDNGVGFDPRYAHKLFGVFQRLHRQDEFEGTGVGLALVQRIVQRHGGKTWAESAPPDGASFYFSLPHNALPPSP